MGNRCDGGIDVGIVRGREVSASWRNAGGGDVAREAVALLGFVKSDAVLPLGMFGGTR